MWNLHSAFQGVSTYVISKDLRLDETSDICALKDIPAQMCSSDICGKILVLAVEKRDRGGKKEENDRRIFESPFVTHYYQELHLMSSAQTFFHHL